VVTKCVLYQCWCTFCWCLRRGGGCKGGAVKKKEQSFRGRFLKVDQLVGREEEMEMERLTLMVPLGC